MYYGMRMLGPRALDHVDLDQTGLSPFGTPFAEWIIRHSDGGGANARFPANREAVREGSGARDFSRGMLPR